MHLLLKGCINYDCMTLHTLALWGLFVALKAYTCLKQIIETWIELKLKKSE